MSAQSTSSLISEDMKVYVAGHRGLAGSAIWRELERQGFNNLVGRPSSELDLRDRPATAAFFATERPDVVVLAAARVGGILANSTYPAEFISDNLRVQVNVLDLAREYGVKRLLFLGSSCIYPKLAEQPITEEALLTGALEPTNDAYAIAKIAGLIHVQALRREFGCSFISAMPTNLYGPNDNFDLQNAHVLPAMLRRFHEAKDAEVEEVVVWGTGTPRREFLHVDDMARACVHLLRYYDSDGHINVGTGEDITIAELAATIADTVGYAGRITYDTSKPDGTPRKLLDVSRLKSLGWQPTINLAAGIAQTYSWYQARQRVTPLAPRQNRRSAALDTITVGNHHVTPDVALRALSDYARTYADVVRFYDCGLTDVATPARTFDMSLLGRLAFVDRSLSASDITALFDAAQMADWASVPVEAALVDAAPSVEGGLYDAAEALHRHFLGAVPRLGSSTVSLVLHLLRPQLFPILDAPIRRIYEDRAVAAWEESQKQARPWSGRSYWPVVREDLLRARQVDVFEAWRGSLRESTGAAEKRLATVSDVRLWDAVARSIASAGQWQGLGGMQTVQAHGAQHRRAAQR